MTKSRRTRKLLLAFGAAIMGLSCFFVLSFYRVEAEEKEETPTGRVMFISSYSYAWDTVRMQIDGIAETLGPGVTLDYEFMDTKRVDDETSRRLFYEGLKYRLSQVEPYDAVILGDDAALLFALEYQDELFAETPLVFEGVNDEELAKRAMEDSMITGVIEKLSVEKNIKLGLKLNPEAERVVAILDDSITGQAERVNFYKHQDLFPELEFKEINCSKMSTDYLKRELQHVNKHSILIYVVMTEDASGKKYSNEESMRLIAENASVPALRMVEAGIGQGVLGGYVVSMSKSGEIAARIAMDIIGGREISEINIEDENPNIYCIDENVMKKFDLDLSVLPEETVIVNGQESFFVRNREALIPGGILVVALLAIIGVIWCDNWKGKKLRKELEEAKSIMEAASQHDFLTGLPNRNKFMEDLKTLIADKKPCAVIMIDIDDFKKINDNYGHTAGDEALQQVAGRLKELVSPILTAYRFAGDEFIMIQHSGQRKIVEKTAYQCRQLFSKNFTLCGEKHKIYGSIGLACYPEDTDNLEQLIVYADDAMYQVKKNGKNDFAFYQKSAQ